MRNFSLTSSSGYDRFLMSDSVQRPRFELFVELLSLV